MKTIPYGHQDINQEDIQAVIEVLKSDWLTQGPAIERFEQKVAGYCGVKYAVAVNSATSALHIACRAAGLQERDELWTTPNTFVASANCGLYCGADVDFVDIDPQTYNISIEKLAKKLRNGKIPKLLIPVHFSGQACEMEPIQRLAKQYGFSVIEDASHAIGGQYKNSKIGACKYSDMTVFSFHPVKIVTTAEGGMVVTNSEELYEKLIRLRSHGITRNEKYMTKKCQGPWYYQQIELGFNYRMTDLQAALGTSQMQRIDEFVKKRRVLAERYNKLLEDLPLIVPYQHPDTVSAWHLYVVQLDSERCKKTRLQVFKELRAAGIGVNVHYIPVHTQPYYQALGHKYGDFPIAERYYEHVISLPIYYGLAESEQEYVVSTLKSVLSMQE